MECIWPLVLVVRDHREAHVVDAVSGARRVVRGKCMLGAGHVYIYDGAGGFFMF
jgi:hypothetical protein